MHQQADYGHYLTRAGRCHVDRGNYSRGLNTVVSCTPSLFTETVPLVVLYLNSKERDTTSWWNIMRMN